LTKARAGRVEQVKAAQEEQRPKKLCNFQGSGRKNIQFFEPVIPSVNTKVLSKKKDIQY
jgi:hypothetical protein